jgi:hypothetical protein
MIKINSDFEKACCKIIKWQSGIKTWKYFEVEYK